MSKFTPMGELFDRFPVARDICARKHGGNPASNITQERILKLIAGYREYGLTLDELSGITGRPRKAISGRLTELRISGKIEKRGTRLTRSGCKAAVYVAV